jgi:hypothetical protein
MLRQVGTARLRRAVCDDCSEAISRRRADAEEALAA